MPTKRATRYAGVLTPYEARWGDAFFGIPTHDIPDYEHTLVEGLLRHVRRGDRIVIVGGGLGITAVIAASATGPGGSVTCYEGSREQVSLIKQVIAQNKPTGEITAIHAVVGLERAVYGSSEGAETISPADLPECDLLELDCEGSEADILEHLTIRPDIILVETHGSYGSPSRKVCDRLERLEYHVKDLGVAEPRLERKCLQEDIRVLLATKSTSL